MADPTTPPPAESAGTNDVAMGYTGVGTLFGAYSQFQAGMANKRAAEFNANYQRMLAQQSIEAGESQVGARTLQERQAIGRTNAGAAGNGVVVGAGSAGAARASQQALAAGDVQTIRTNAIRQAYGYNVDAFEQQRRARMALETARQNATGTLIGGMAEEELESDPKFAGFRRSGVPTGGN